ncbi:hypothetical protein EW026_g2677 [Hermanssonia centrifuga]|uniref:Cytochrome P450 n=1 Tax=Hermanssonia centrifuga TaxID=98765 RepID=A0A4S4KMJ9_9APHY|nr:hypothetical protein EW026_g2677 [Hermanssonia centrifuga]
MVLYPDVMRRAQAEIDAVIGRDRTPSFSDRDKLPYIEAIVKEVIRWRPVDPLGVPRRSTEDDWYKGYFIPAGTVVIFNVWAMNRNPKYFPDAEEFRPERYLDDSGQLAEAIPDTHGHGHFAFGSGRRICPGRDFANQAFFINIATLLWAFDFEKALDSAGQPIIPSRTDCIDEGIMVRPAPFKCAIKPRSTEVGPLINSIVATFS